jgi:hypothetical protein
LKFFSWILRQTLSDSQTVLPDKAFSSETLKNAILEMPESDLPYALKSVDEVKPPQSSSSKDDSSLKTPVVAGAIIAVVVYSLVLSLLFI